MRVKEQDLEKQRAGIKPSIHQTNNLIWLFARLFPLSALNYHNIFGALGCAFAVQVPLFSDRRAHSLRRPWRTTNLKIDRFRT